MPRLIGRDSLMKGDPYRLPRAILERQDNHAGNSAPATTKHITLPPALGVIILFKWSKDMKELIEFLGGAPKSCADCIHSEWVNDPYATGDSPGGWECGAYSCEFSERIAVLCSEYDKIENTISEKEDAGEDCSELYQLLDSADGILNYGFGWA